MSFLEIFYTQFVPIFLFAVMMAMGLSLTLQDFQRVAKQPKALLAGLGAQLLLLPILAIAMGFALGSPPVIAAGAIILAACPGGVTSNAYVFASRADVALSIGLTAVASFITVFSIPFLTLFALELHMDQSTIPELDKVDMMWSLARFTIVPVSLGMLLRYWKPEIALRIIEPLRIGTLLSLIGIVVVGTATAWATIVLNAWSAGTLMVAINIIAMSLGFLLARGLRLPFKQRATITFEVGVQNLSLALFVTLTFLKSPELAIATLVYALIMKVTALSFVWFVRQRLAQ